MAFSKILSLFFLAPPSVLLLFSLPPFFPFLLLLQLQLKNLQHPLQINIREHPRRGHGKTVKARGTRHIL